MRWLRKYWKWIALVLGLIGLGTGALARTPGGIGGPLGWAPLLYACHSVYADPAAVRALLARGAPGDASRAADLLQEAELLAHNLGMQSLAAQATRARSATSAPTQPSR